MPGDEAGPTMSGSSRGSGSVEEGMGVVDPAAATGAAPAAAAAGTASIPLPAGATGLQGPRFTQYCCVHLRLIRADTWVWTLHQHSACGPCARLCDRIIDEGFLRPAGGPAADDTGDARAARRAGWYHVVLTVRFRSDETSTVRCP